MYVLERGGREGGRRKRKGKEKKKRRREEIRAWESKEGFSGKSTAHRAHLSVDTSRLLGYLIVMDL